MAAMSRKLKDFYNLNDENDEKLLLEYINDDELDDECERVLDRLADHSDLDGWSSGSDLDITASEPHEVRIGAEKVSRSEIAVIENENDHEDLYDEEDNIPLSEIKKKLSKSKAKSKRNDIVWKKQPFVAGPVETIQCLLDHTAPSDNDDLLPILYFTKYIPEGMFSQISEMTNIYALQAGNTNFRPTSKNEIKSFVGLHMMISCLKFPRLSMFWDRSLHIDVFTNTMSRNRFYQLRSNVHLVNNLEKPEGNTDKLFKVRPIYECIRRRCHELEKETNLSVDEQMVPFTGHLSIKQYIKGKPNPWGIKIFVLAGQSGLAYDFAIYQGSTTDFNKNDLDEYGLGASVVLHLTKDVTRGHHIYFDNYFTSYKLLKTLKTRGLYAAGTVRVNRFNNPPLFTDKEASKKERGFSDEVTDSSGDIVLCKWVDNRTVILGSNFVGKGQEDEVDRWDKKNNKYMIHRPEVIKLYNQSMGGVDKLDQLLGLYRIFIKSRKWTLRMIFHAVDLACVNSWLEYKRDFSKQNQSKEKFLDLLHFKMRLAESLIKMGNPVNNLKRPVGRPSSSENRLSPIANKRKALETRPLLEIQLDMIDHLPEIDNRKEATRCKNGSCSGKTHIYCEKCVVHLCFVKKRNCFKLYHRR